MKSPFHRLFNNCGTGAGGFQPGNTCGAGGGFRPFGEGLQPLPEIRPLKTNLHKPLSSGALAVIAKFAAERNEQREAKVPPPPPIPPPSDRKFWESELVAEITQGRLNYEGRKGIERILMYLAPHDPEVFQDDFGDLLFIRNEAAEALAANDEQAYRDINHEFVEEVKFLKEHYGEPDED